MSWNSPGASVWRCSKLPRKPKILRRAPRAYPEARSPMLAIADPNDRSQLGTLGPVHKLPAERSDGSDRLRQNHIEDRTRPCRKYLFRSQDTLSSPWLFLFFQRIRISQIHFSHLLVNGRDVVEVDAELAARMRCPFAVFEGDFVTGIVDGLAILERL